MTVDVLKHAMSILLVFHKGILDTLEGESSDIYFKPQRGLRAFFQAPLQYCFYKEAKCFEQFIIKLVRKKT